MNKTFSAYVYEILEDEGFELTCECETMEELHDLCDILNEEAFDEYKESYVAYCSEVGQEPIWDLE